MSLKAVLEQTKRPPAAQMSLFGDSKSAPVNKTATPVAAEPPATDPPPQPDDGPIPKLPQHIDPRPDITHDAATWRATLRTVWRMVYQRKIPEHIYGLFHGLRCGGAELKTYPDWTIQIKRGQWSQEDYADIRDNWLIPNTEYVVAVLGELTRLLREQQ